MLSESRLIPRQLQHAVHHLRSSGKLSALCNRLESRRTISSCMTVILTKLRLAGTRRCSRLEFVSSVFRRGSRTSLVTIQISIARSISLANGKHVLTWPALSPTARSEEHTSELQSHSDLVCRLLLEKKKK